MVPPVLNRSRSYMNHLLGVMAGLSRPSTSAPSLPSPACRGGQGGGSKKDVDARNNPRIKSGDGHDPGEVIRSFGPPSGEMIFRAPHDGIEQDRHGGEHADQTQE